MDSGKRRLKTFEELNEMKERSEAMKKMTDESSKLLEEAHTSADSILSALKKIDAAGKQMRNVADDIKDQLASDGVDIDEESVRANYATNVSPDTANSDVDNTGFLENLNLGAAFQNVEEKKFVRKDKEFMNKLHFVTELVVYYDRDDKDKGKKPLSAFTASRSRNLAGKSDKTNKPVSASTATRSLPDTARIVAGKSDKINKPTSSATKSLPDTARNVAGKKGKKGKKSVSASSASRDLPEAARNVAAKCDKTNKPTSTLLETRGHPSWEARSVTGTSDGTNIPVSTLSAFRSCPSSQAIVPGTSGPPVLRSYDELTAWKRDIDATRQKKEDEMSRLLVEAHSIASSMAANLEDILVAGSQLCKETMDIKSEFSSEDSLNTGKESVLPLIELENNATEVFNNIAKDEEEMEKLINRKDQFMKQLNSTEELIAGLQIGRETVKTESTLSVTRNVEASKTTLCRPCHKRKKK